MAEIKVLLDAYGVIYEANKCLPDNDHKVQLVEALAELENNDCHKTRTYPITRLHRVTGIEQAIYRADINKTTGWRLHVQFDKNTKQLHLKDIIEGKLHDDVINVIKAKKYRYK